MYTIRIPNYYNTNDVSRTKRLMKNCANFRAFFATSKQTWPHVEFFPAAPWSPLMAQN